MTRLPTRDDLGGLPSAKTGTSIISYEQPIAKTSAKGLGMASFGEALGAFGDVLHRKAQERDEYDTERRYQEFEFEQEKHVEETLRNVQPGQAKGLADNTTSGYQERAREFFATVPDHLKEKYDGRLFNTERGIYGKTRNFELHEQKRASVQELEDHKTMLSQDDDIEKARAKQQAVIDKNPDLSPIEKEELKRKHLEDLDYANIIRQLEKDDTDYEALEKELEKPGYVKSEPVGPVEIKDLPESGIKARPRKGKIEGVVLHHTAGDSLEGAISWGAKKGTGTNYYIDRDGTVVRAVDDGNATTHMRETGDKFRSKGKWENLGNDNTIGIEVVGKSNKDITPEQKSAIRSLLADLEKRHGIDRANIIGHGEVQGGPGGNRESDEGALAAEYRTGIARVAQDGPVPLEDRAITGPRSKGVQVADASGRTATDASPEGTQDPSTVGRFPYLSAEKRTQLLGMVKNKKSEKRISEYWQADERLKGAVAMMEEQGALPPDFNLEKNLQILREAKQETKAERYGIEVAAAKEVYKARYAEDGRPLEEMSDEELTAHMGRLTKEKLDVKDTGEYGLKARILDSIDGRVRKLRDLREKDAALAVSQSPEVKTAISKQDPENPNWETIIEARLAAQGRLGIDPKDRRGLTEAEARSLFSSTQFGRMSEKEVLDVMTEASQLAQQRYGSYAGRAIDDGISFFVKENKAYEAARGVLSKIAKGQPVTRRDERQVDEMRRIEAAEKAFRSGGERFGPYGFESTATREAYGPPVPPPQSAKPKRQPTQDAINHLLSNPDTARAFNEWHNGGEESGDNSAAAWLAKLSKQKVSK